LEGDASVPDWNYQTLVKPILQTLPDETGHKIAIYAVRFLGSTAISRKLIDLMGHMFPPKGIGFQIGKTKFPSRVLLGRELDPRGLGIKAFSKFGFGGIEVTFNLSRASKRSLRDFKWIQSSQLTLGYAESLQNISELGEIVDRSLVPVIAVIDGEISHALALNELLAHIDEVSSTTPTVRLCATIVEFIFSNEKSDIEDFMARLKEIERQNAASLVFSFSIGVPRVDFLQELEILRTHKFTCLHLSNSMTNEKTVFSKEDLAAQLNFLKINPILQSFQIISGSGVYSPTDYEALRISDVTAVTVSHGIIEAGPGLPKRLNQFEEWRQGFAKIRKSSRPAVRMSWFWGGLLGISMFFGGLLTLLIAKTEILFPYDEVASGIKLAALAKFNESILHFMAHDRATLAGTMLSLGILYASFSWYGTRRGLSWYREAVSFSALFGFLNFFTFMSYGYFDVFHAFVTACLFQIFIMSVYAYFPTARELPRPYMQNDRIWKAALWGQLLFVVQGLGLIFAGLVITYFGSTSVFVPEDSEYLGMSIETLRSFNGNLVPLIAHDRCTFGGMLISAGICISLSSLWGFESGQKWLWWTYLLSGLPPYMVTLWIHDSIGYVSLAHLMPVYVGLALLGSGLALSARYFHETHISGLPHPTHAEE
jgi:hypothetical protein